jgi:hypothetical protein
VCRGYPAQFHMTEVLGGYLSDDPASNSMMYNWNMVSGVTEAAGSGYGLERGFKRRRVLYPLRDAFRLCDPLESQG